MGKESFLVVSLLTPMMEKDLSEIPWSNQERHESFGN